jgi:hypothetical protein
MLENRYRHQHKAVDSCAPPIAMATLAADTVTPESDIGQANI